MKFYQIKKPTTAQIFEAIINGDYVPLEKIQSKAKQIKILLSDHFCSEDLLITFKNVTNCGGFPIFLSSNSSIYEVLSEQEGFCYLTQEEQEKEEELLCSYLQSYDKTFNL